MKFVVEEVGPIRGSVFELPSRGLVVVYGPNGSGKTLLSLAISSYFFSGFLVECSHRLFGGGFADRVLDDVWSRIYKTCDYGDKLMFLVDSIRDDKGRLFEFREAFRRYVFHAEFLRNLSAEDFFEGRVDLRKVLRLFLYRAVLYGGEERREVVLDGVVPLPAAEVSKLGVYGLSEEKYMGINVTDSAVYNLFKLIERGGAVSERMVIPSVMLLYVVRFLKQIFFEESSQVIRVLFKVLASASDVVEGVPRDLNVMYEGGKAYVKVRDKWVSVELLSRGLKKIYMLYEVAKMLPWVTELGYRPVLYIEEPETHLESIIVYKLPIFLGELIYRYNSAVIVTTHSPEVFYGVEKCLDEGVLRSGDVYVYETVREGGFFKLRRIEVYDNVIEVPRLVKIAKSILLD